MTNHHGGLRRFAADLPRVTEFVTLGEGDTPLLPLPRLAAELGLNQLSAKLESTNPTGSYKDRVAAMTMALARDRGYRGWIATSSGNAGMAMAAYGRRAGLPGFLCLVASAPQQKRLPLVPYGTGVAAVHDVGDGGSAAAGTRLMEAVRDAATRHQLFVAITAGSFNPDGMRGIDTIGYELAEQASDITHVYVPTGGGGLLTSVGRGLARRGIPAALIACQPSGCAPITRYLAGELDAPAIQRCDTSISALQLPHPPDGLLAADAVRASHGWGTDADDDAILTAQQRLATTEGVFVEPAAACAVAALVEDVDHGRVGPDHHPVVILTGAGWKDLGRYTTMADQIPVHAVDTVAAAVDTWAEHL
ncbi:pyridoxal-phosphate dependent enzyme [Phytoactinopolyspora limicola]|uniref:pyridoxal-phosphate dependent enzyme n=1 Tax=Phytoactinopolyspora limicola TaxID=2715536 RepID=UPI00140E0D86|nr:pyridoxal-phosphate dependent enzyme [Phytoactinopolyspora limicola]